MKVDVESYLNIIKNIIPKITPFLSDLYQVLDKN